MPKTIIAGKTTPTFQGNIFTWDPRGGYKVDSSYKGPIGTTLPLSGQFSVAGIAHNYSEAGGVATITMAGATAATLGSNEVPVDSWQLVGNELQKDLYEHPNSLTIESAQAGALGLIRKDISLYNDGQSPQNTAKYPSSQTALIQKFIALQLRGATHYGISRAVLRHTQTVSYNYSYDSGAFNFKNIEKIYNTQQLTEECKGFYRPLPGFISDAMKAIPSESATGYTWGWKKAAPTVSTVGESRIEISTEFSLDLWNTDYVYGLYSAS